SWRPPVWRKTLPSFRFGQAEQSVHLAKPARHKATASTGHANNPYEINAYRRIGPHQRALPEPCRIILYVQSQGRARSAGDPMRRREREERGSCARMTPVEPVGAMRLDEEVPARVEVDTRTVPAFVVCESCPPRAQRVTANNGACL